jgi:hypothetical protein
LPALEAAWANGSGRLTAEKIRKIRREVVNQGEARRLGKERQIYEAKLRSGWDGYAGAIATARDGNVSRLVDCLRGRKPLTDDDRHCLASYIATKARRRRWPMWLERALTESPTEADYDLLADLVERTGRGPGRVFDEPAHHAARLARVILSMWPGRKPEALRYAVIEHACAIVGNESGAVIDPERVRNMLDHPKSRG